MDDDFGSALTGQKVDPVTATGQWDDFLNRPGNRQALLQIGLQMMQPVGIGQTAGGHIAQAIGAGGEAVDRGSNIDLKERIADAKMADADEKLTIAQQNADANTSRAATARERANAPKKSGGLTDAFKARAARQDAMNFDRQLDRDAKEILKQANDVLGDPNSEVAKKYKGKTVPEIREMLRAERPKPKYGNVPTNEDDGEDDDATTPAAPQTPGAKQAPDGNWYVPDPKRPGKYLKVTQ